MISFFLPCEISSHLAQNKVLVNTIEILRPSFRIIILTKFTSSEPFLVALFHDKGFGFLLEEDIPTMLHVITQCTKVLTSDLISFLYIKVTHTLHLSSESSQDLV
jgi:hypothetical protein